MHECNRFVIFPAKLLALTPTDYRILFAECLTCMQRSPGGGGGGKGAVTVMIHSVFMLQCTCNFFIWRPFLLGGDSKVKATLQRTSP